MILNMRVQHAGFLNLDFITIGAPSCGYGWAWNSNSPAWERFRINQDGLWFEDNNPQVASTWPMIGHLS